MSIRYSATSSSSFSFCPFSFSASSGIAMSGNPFCFAQKFQEEEARAKVVIEKLETRIRECKVSN